MKKNENDRDLTEEEANALAEGLRESAQILDKWVEAKKLYEELDRKYPLKGKNKPPRKD